MTAWTVHQEKKKQYLFTKLSSNYQHIAANQHQKQKESVIYPCLPLFGVFPVLMVSEEHSGLESSGFSTHCLEELQGYTRSYKFSDFCA